LAQIAEMHLNSNQILWGNKNGIQRLRSKAVD